MKFGNIEFAESSETKYFYGTEYDPNSCYFCLFGWQYYGYNVRKEDNTYTSEEWDGDGYSTRTYGSVDKYYSSHYARIIPRSSDFSKKFKEFINKKCKPIYYEVTLSDIDKQIAKAKGNYYELLKETERKNEDKRAEVEKKKIEYNNTANALLLDAIYEYSGKRLTLPQYDFAEAEHYQKHNKEFIKAVKKINKTLVKELELEAARTFNKANNSSLRMLSDYSFQWLKKCFDKYRKSI